MLVVTIHYSSVSLISVTTANSSKLRNAKKLLQTIVVTRKNMSTEHRSKISQYNLSGKKLEAFLGPLEANVIETIWNSENKTLTVREVYEKLRARKKIAYTTVMSTMNRLYDKGLLERRIKKGKGGLYYIYWPKLEEENFKKSAVREVVNSLLENFGDIVKSCIIEETASSEKESKALKEQLGKSTKEKEK